MDTLNEAHAAQLQVKNDHIAYLKQWMPVSGVEQLEAVKTLFKMQLDSAQEKIDLLTNQNTSEQEKRQQLESEYTDQIDTLTLRLKEANEFQMKLLRENRAAMTAPLLPTPSRVDLNNVNLWLHTDLVPTSLPWTTIITDWPEWLAQYRRTTSTLSPDKDEDAPTDEADKSDTQEHEDN